jgi:hypothetical protein
MKNNIVAHIALPVLNEYKNLHLFIKNLKKQSFANWELTVCVNQYDSWWNGKENKKACIDNSKSIDFLKNLNDNRITVLDRSSKGKGWKDKKGGVGFARKTAMDYIAAKANGNDIIISADADTIYPENWIAEIVSYFNENIKVSGLSLPYYHPLPEDEKQARLILRYEIYMRHYALNMIRINNPYRFTALGSAMAFPVWAYKKTGGLTPVQAGEDFYFLQKLVKSGKIGYTADTVVFPSARFSSRVNFGTGPALIKGASGDWNSYPIYPHHFFDEIAETYQLFHRLYYRDTPLPVDTFLKKQFGNAAIWQPLKDNYKDLDNFVKACINKIDGLRILQYLRFRLETTKTDSDEENLKKFIYSFYHKDMPNSIDEILTNLDFENTPTGKLNLLRNFLFQTEKKERTKRG